MPRRPVVPEFYLKAPCPTSEYSKPFLQGMVDRMAVSYHKYGAVDDAYPDRVDALASLSRRLEEYARTGNTEFLIDAANFAMIEFMCPRHPEAHFEATDSAASPGRITTSGNVNKVDKNTRLISNPVRDE